MSNDTKKHKNYSCFIGKCTVMYVELVLVETNTKNINESILENLNNNQTENCGHIQLNELRYGEAKKAM